MSVRGVGWGGVGWGHTNDEKKLALSEHMLTLSQRRLRIEIVCIPRGALLVRACVCVREPKMISNDANKYIC